MAMIKAKPKQMSYGSAGSGTSMHLAGELFKQMAHLEVIHSPYKGSNPAMVDLLAGHIQYGVMDLATPSAILQSRRLRALAVSTDAAVVGEGRATRHKTAAGEDVSGFRYVAFDNGLKLFYQPDLELLLVHDDRRAGTFFAGGRRSLPSLSILG